MAVLVLFNQDYSPFENGKTYLLEDKIASTVYNENVGTIISEPVNIENASITVDFTTINQTLTGGNQTTKIIDNTGNQFNVGVCNGCVAAQLSDTVDLTQSGYIQPRALAGDIKVTDVNDNVNTLTFELKEISPFRVKRVWSSGTTANMDIYVYY